MQKVFALRSTNPTPRPPPRSIREGELDEAGDARHFASAAAEQRMYLQTWDYVRCFALVAVILIACLALNG